MKRFGDTSRLCKETKCGLKKNCIRFLALVEKKDELDGSEQYLEECDRMVVELPHEHHSTGCIYCSKEGRCYKQHRLVCKMECNNCAEYQLKTL